MPLTPSPAVLRACDVLDELAKHPAERLSVSELARSVGAPRATCDTVLLALADRGLVHRSTDLRYSLGAACCALGDAAHAARAELVALEPLAEDLARATSSCVVISSSDGATARVERMIDHAPGIAMRARVGESVPLAPPFGAVFVAWNDETIEDWLDRAGGAMPEDERAHARTALAAVRRRGYVLSTDIVRPELVNLLVELADGFPDSSQLELRDALIRSLAPSRYLPIELPTDRPQRVAQITAPVFDAANAVTFSLMILGPGYDLQPEEIAAYGSQLLVAANEATRRLGGHNVRA
jgi:DNA-binding IclR family transcriptional regulator